MLRKSLLNPDVWRTAVCVLAVPALMWVGSSGAAPSSATESPKATNRQELDRQFTRTVRPFLQTFCNDCHGKDKPQAQLDLSGYTTTASVVRDLAHWSLVMDRVAARQMPPASMDKQPTTAQREAVIAWIRALRQSEIQRNAGDPGTVLARRLSNAEYDNTIRDLTGVDMRPTREFPVDPANQEGFDNSGESLTVSPALMKKYVQAAKEVADNMALTSTGLEFASHPVLAETDRDKFCILRIVDFYKNQPTDYADYFMAAWRYQNRVALGIPNATLPSLAADAHLSPRYLQMIWNTLINRPAAVGPLAQLQEKWDALPDPDSRAPDAARAECVALRDWVVGFRKKVAWKFDNLPVPRGFSPGGQCFVLWKDRQYATHRRMLYPDALQINGVPHTHTIHGRRRNGVTPPDTYVTDAVDADLFVPKDEAARAPYIASFEAFCNVFPDAFYIAERGRMFVDDAGDKGRLLTAGLHNSMGYFRDDTPLKELLLDDKDRQTLDNMWQDFDMVAFIPERMHLEFFVYERAESGTITDPEFNFARAEDKSATSDALISRLAKLYYAKAQRLGAAPSVLGAITEHFQRVSHNIRTAEKERLAAEPIQRKSLLLFAARAYRRPLTDAERADLLGFYAMLRKKEGLTHEDALRDTVVSVLMSPNFLYRVDLEGGGAAIADNPPPPPGRRTASVRRGGPRVEAIVPPPSLPAQGESAAAFEPLGDYELASRLSYFLWSTMPDDKLLAHAAKGDLHRPNVLASETRRMLRDRRVRGLSLDFGGNWLDFRRFEEHNAVDRNRFPGFTNDLREAMFEEPVHFLTDTFQHDRSVRDLIYGKYTFVNRDLAKHYRMPAADVPVRGSDWVRVDNADRYGRGGLLPMAVFLTKNSPGLRTSPVKRGYWVVKRLLGETIPPPPAVVPDLPSDESKMGDLTLRQALAAHRANPACASCHARFDSYGLVFEGYGPTGEQRAKDFGGKPVDIRAPFGGGEFSGVAGLQDFVRREREKEFLDNMSRKLLSYGLGRSLQPSDDPLLFRMHQRLVAGDYRFGTLVETIVTSRQFLNHRIAADKLARK